MRARPPLRGIAILLAACCLLAGTAARARAEDDTKEVRKAFRTTLKSEDWRVRSEAYFKLADYEGAAVVEEILDAMEREKNPAVILAGVRTLAGFQTAEAQAALDAVLAKGHGKRKSYVLLALTRQRGDESVDILMATLGGKDVPAAAQAALALGRKRVEEALPALLRLVGHKDWQMRVAVARALTDLATPPPPPPPPNATAEQLANLPKRMPTPAFMKDPAITKALVSALASSKGRERGDIVSALEAIHDEEYGYNLVAWRKVAAGAEVTPADLKKRVYPPYVYGIPIYGRRVVLIFDGSLRSGDPHRFGNGERLLELCKVPGSRPLLPNRLLTVGQFSAAHFKRGISSFPKGVKFELVVYNATVHATFGKLTPANAGSKKLAIETIDGTKPDDGIATYPAFTYALDIGGASDASAWKKGPDEILYVTSNIPTAGDIVEADVVGAAVAMKARMRMVTIHTIGIETHPYGMMETIATETGGVYRNYYE
jgi:hypothetical protein